MRVRTRDYDRVIITQINSSEFRMCQSETAKRLIIKSNIYVCVCGCNAHIAKGNQAALQNMDN